MELYLENEALGVHQQVALTAFGLLTTVVASLFATHSPVVLTDWLSTTPALG